MAERKTYTYTPFTYQDYTKSQDVINAETNKANAENALANYGDYTKSQDVINAETNKANAENALTNYGDFSYKNQGLFDDVMNKILNREKFSYDLNGDALYQQYKDKYIQQGKMAMADTMGQAAAMTGGYGNSYAASVGNQAYQASLQNLNDVIPELYQMAYDRYNQEGQDLYNQYGMLSDDRSMEYGMWGDKYNRLAADRDYYSTDANNAFNKDYGMWGDKRNMLVTDRDYYSTEANNAFNRDYSMYSADRTLAHDEHTTSEGYKYQDVADANAFAQYNETMNYRKDRDKVTDSQWSKEFGLKSAPAAIKPPSMTASEYNDFMTNVGDYAYEDTTGDKLALYLNGMVANNSISQDTATQIFKQYFPVTVPDFPNNKTPKNASGRIGLGLIETHVKN